VVFWYGNICQFYKRQITCVNLSHKHITCRHHKNIDFSNDNQHAFTYVQSHTNNHLSMGYVDDDGTNSDDSDIIETDNEVSPDVAIKGNQRNNRKKMAINSDELIDDYDIIPTKFTEYWVYTFTETSWTEYEKYNELNITCFENYNVRKGDVIFFYCKRRVAAGFVGLCRVAESQKVNQKKGFVKIFRDGNMNTYIIPLNYLRFFKCNKTSAEKAIRVEQIIDVVKADVSGYRNVLSFKMKFIKVQNCLTKMDMNGRHLLTKLFDLVSVKDGHKGGREVNGAIGSTNVGSHHISDDDIVTSSTSNSSVKSDSLKSSSKSDSLKSSSKSDSLKVSTSSASIKSSSKSDSLKVSTSSASIKSSSNSASIKSSSKSDTIKNSSNADTLKVSTNSASIKSSSAYTNSDNDTIKPTTEAPVSETSKVSRAGPDMSTQRGTCPVKEPEIDTEDEFINDDILNNYTDSISNDSISSIAGIKPTRSKMISVRPNRKDIFEEYKINVAADDSDPIPISDASTNNGFKCATSSSDSPTKKKTKWSNASTSSPLRTDTDKKHQQKTVGKDTVVSSDSSQYYPSYKESDDEETDRDDDTDNDSKIGSDNDEGTDGDEDGEGEGEGIEEDDDGDDEGIIPILVIPCKNFVWPKKKGDMEKYFVDHYKTCRECDVTNNNTIELSSFIDKATVEIVDIEDEDEPYIEYPLEAYDNLKRHCPDDMNNSDGTPFIRVAKINQCHDVYRNCLLVTGAV